MIHKQVVRRVTRRTYDKYAFVDYSVNTDNLNPINPTQLEAQVDEITQAARGKLIEAYGQARVEVPQELLDYNVSPTTMLNSLNDLINKTKQGALDKLINQLDSNVDLASSVVSQANTNPIGTQFFDNPLKLDCNGIQIFGETSDNSDDNDNDDDEDDSEDDESEDDGSDEDVDEADKDDDYDGTSSGTSSGGVADLISIVYKNLMETEDISTWPQKLNRYEFPLKKSDIPLPVEAPDGQVFNAWFKDESLTDKLKDKDEIPDPGAGGTVTLYAQFKEEADDDGLDDDNAQDPDLPEGGEEKECDEVNLSWLKIILIIIIILKILVMVIVLICNIQKVIAAIAKDAQLCWINPPSLQSLISYVLQRLGAIIFQIVGMILLKLWAMLGLDCLSDNTLKTIDQINSALAGLMDALGEVCGVAMDMKDAAGSMWQALKDMVTNLQSDLEKQLQDLQDAYKNIPTELGQVGQQLKDTYTNPQTYLDMVPAEIRARIFALIDAYDTTKSNILRITETVNKLRNKGGDEDIPKTPKNVEIIAV